MNEPRDEHDDLRQLFADAASDIRPQGSLEEILDRTKKVDPMTRRWFLPVVAAAAVIGFVIGGAFWIANDPNTPDHGPAGPTTTAPVPTTITSLVYYLGAGTTGQRLFSEPTVLHSASGIRSEYAMDAANLAISGKATDPDYSSAWPAGTKVTGAGGCDHDCDVQVNFPSRSIETRPAGMTEAVARLSLDQLIRTVQAAMDTDQPVLFTVDNPAGSQPLTRVLGIDTSPSVRPLADDDNELAMVQISSPADSASVPAGDLVVTGRAATFEANVLWELKSSEGTVVQHGHTTAAVCCTLSPYSFTIKNLQPGYYTVVVHDEDMSGSGRPVNQDTKEIVVR